jgi:hypothetical protein
MRPSGIARTTGVLARAARAAWPGQPLGAPPGGRGSMVPGIAVVALTTRIHHYGTSGRGGTTGLIIAIVAIVIIAGFRWITRWYTRNRRN